MLGQQRCKGLIECYFVHYGGACFICQPGSFRPISGTELLASPLRYLCFLWLSRLPFLCYGSLDDIHVLHAAPVLPRRPTGSFSSQSHFQCSYRYISTCISHSCLELQVLKRAHAGYWIFRLHKQARAQGWRLVHFVDLWQCSKCTPRSWYVPKSTFLA